GLPGLRVDHRGYRACVGAAGPVHLHQRGAAHVDDPLVVDGVLHLAVAVAPTPTRHPELVEDPAVPVAAGQFVAVSVAHEGVFDLGPLNEVDVLAGVTRVQGDPHRGQVQGRQVVGSRYAHHGKERRIQVGHVAVLT